MACANDALLKAALNLAELEVDALSSVSVDMTNVIRDAFNAAAKATSLDDESVCKLVEVVQTGYHIAFSNASWGGKVNLVNSGAAFNTRLNEWNIVKSYDAAQLAKYEAAKKAKLKAVRIGISVLSSAIVLGGTALIIRHK